MGVFKEEIDMLEDLYKKQVQIYSDACDYGVIATPNIKNIMRDVIKALPGMAKPTWKSDSPYTIQRTYESTVEWGGGNATLAKVLYCNDKKAKKEFFSIYLQAVRTSDEDY